jgi:hypothetical protein
MALYNQRTRGSKGIDKEKRKTIKKSEGNKKEKKK